jgi:BASS family bile acid:Na+ symporter
MHGPLSSLDSLTVNFGSGNAHVLNVILAFVMFGVALDIKMGELKNVFYKPKPLILGLVGQLILVPGITFCLAAIFYKQITLPVAIGMILVAACPGGNMSNFMSSLARANTALSVGLTGINTAIAFIATPFNFAFWGGLYIRYLGKRSSEMLQPLEIDMWHMLFTLVILLVLPLFAGIIFSRLCPKLKEKVVKPFKIFSIIAFAAILCIALANNLDNFINHLGYIFIIVLIHNGLIILAGAGWSRLFGFSLRDRMTIAIEMGIQNSGLGLALLLNPKIFPEGSIKGGTLFVVAWWGIWHIISGFLTAYIGRRKIKQTTNFEQ